MGDKDKRRVGGSNVDKNKDRDRDRDRNIDIDKRDQEKRSADTDRQRGREGKMADREKSGGMEAGNKSQDEGKIYDV